MNKFILRKEYLDIRKRIEDKDSKSELIFKRILLEDILKYDLYLCYYSLDLEVDTLRLIRYLLDNNKDVAIPRVEEDIIRFYYIRSLEDVSLGTFKVMEPNSNSLVLNYDNSICFVPGICFDYEGFRVGYGKGFYDRFLVNYNGDRIGLCFDDCIVSKIDRDEYDQSVSTIITEKRLIKKRTID